MAYIKVEHNINTDDYSADKLAAIVKQIKVLEDLIKETQTKELEKEVNEKILDGSFWE